jgi:YaiO family outer membrane protein
MKRNTNVVQALYSIDCFDHNAPQHLANLGYAFKVGKHSLALRANYADRYKMNDVLLESDFYLQMNNKAYMYFNYGYSFDASMFPRHRAGYEYYMPLKYKMEASLGARYMKYINSEVFIATGHLEKYMGNHWLAFRPFYVMQDNGNSCTLLANYRFYGKNPLNYWGVELTYGNSPDDSRTTMENAAFNNLDAYKIKLERNFMLNSISDVRIGIGYTREEYATSKFRNRYLIELGCRFRLK